MQELTGRLSLQSSLLVSKLRKLFSLSRALFNNGDVWAPENVFRSFRKPTEVNRSCELIQDDIGYLILATHFAGSLHVSARKRTEIIYSTPRLPINDSLSCLSKLAWLHRDCHVQPRPPELFHPGVSLWVPLPPKHSSGLPEKQWTAGNPPAPKVLGRDLPDGTRKRLQVYLGGGGGIFRPKPPVFDRSWRSPSKNTVKNSTEDTCSWTRPSKIGKRKVKKTRVFQLFDLNFLVCNIFFCGSAGGLARRRIFEFLDPFSDWFSSFCDSRNTCFYSVFLFSACLTARFKTSKNLVNYAVLCYGVNENIVNTSVFWRWLKKHCKLQCFWPPDPQKPWYLQWFLLLTAQKHCK